MPLWYILTGVVVTLPISATDNMAAKIEALQLEPQFKKHVDKFGWDLTCSACAHSTNSLRLLLGSKEKRKMDEDQKRKVVEEVLGQACEKENYPAKIAAAGADGSRVYRDWQALMSSGGDATNLNMKPEHLNDIQAVCQTVMEEFGDEIAKIASTGSERMGAFNWEKWGCVKRGPKCEKVTMHKGEDEDDDGEDRENSEQEPAKEVVTKTAKKRKAKTAQGSASTTPVQKDSDLPTNQYCGANDARCNGGPAPKRRKKKKSEISRERDINRLVLIEEIRADFLQSVLEHERECEQSFRPRMNMGDPPQEEHLRIAWNTATICGTVGGIPSVGQQCSPTMMLFTFHQLSLLTLRHAKQAACCRTRAAATLWDHHALSRWSQESALADSNPSLLELRLAETLHEAAVASVRTSDMALDDTQIVDIYAIHQDGRWWKALEDAAEAVAAKGCTPEALG